MTKDKKPLALMAALACGLCILLAACPSSAHPEGGQQPTPTPVQSSVGPSPTPTAVPYSLKIPFPGTSIFEGPGYDYSFAGTIDTAGSFLIVQEEADYEGILWGRLESGGWIDLAAATSPEAHTAPIWVQFADEEALHSGNYQSFIAGASEFMVPLLFTPGEELREVQFSSLGYGDDGGYEVQECLYTLEELTPDKPFAAGVVFYGDMTAYGLSFIDAQGQARHFAVLISGRNGSLLLEEYEP